MLGWLGAFALAEAPAAAQDAAQGIAGNPGAVDVEPGTGELGRLIGLGPDSGVRLGGVLVSNGNYLASGGNSPGVASFNNLFVTGLNADLGKLINIPGATVGAALLQFDGQPTNQQAGVVTGYNSLPGAPPLDRTELYELWWRQSLFADAVVVRFGKLVPTNDFGNVARPVPVQDPSLQIPAVSGLLYTPIFVNPTILGFLPGYYNSAYGVTATLAPNQELVSLSWGLRRQRRPAECRPVWRQPRPSTAIASKSPRAALLGSLVLRAFLAPSPSAPGTRPDCSPRQAPTD